MSTPKLKHPRAGQGGGALGGPRTDHRHPSKARHVSKTYTQNFAGSVLLNRGEVNHVPDGKGGGLQISNINPGALRPASREGNN